jgi:hypothetical protein
MINEMSLMQLLPKCQISLRKSPSPVSRLLAPFAVDSVLVCGLHVGPALAVECPRTAEVVHSIHLGLVVIRPRPPRVLLACSEPGNIEHVRVDQLPAPAEPMWRAQGQVCLG